MSDSYQYGYEKLEAYAETLKRERDAARAEVERLKQEIIEQRDTMVPISDYQEACAERDVELEQLRAALREVASKVNMRIQPNYHQWLCLHYAGGEGSSGSGEVCVRITAATAAALEAAIVTNYKI